MECKKIEKENFAGETVEILDATYEEGKPTGEGMGQWQHKLISRKDILYYLQTGERYWFGKDWFGSEKRKNPA